MDQSAFRLRTGQGLHFDELLELPLAIAACALIGIFALGIASAEFFATKTL
jgi:hypothetical protein